MYIHDWLFKGQFPQTTLYTWFKDELKIKFGPSNKQPSKPSPTFKIDWLVIISEFIISELKVEFAIT